MVTERLFQGVTQLAQPVTGSQPSKLCMCEVYHVAKFFRGPAAKGSLEEGLPASAYLNTGLADVNGDDLTHGCN